MNQVNDAIKVALEALEGQRPILGDAATDAAIAALQAHTAAPVAQSVSAPSQWEGERKLVTVVFADISGFTALSEQLDPEEVRGLMNECFDRLVPVIERYGGTIDKFIGDEIMALFGAPVALEDHAEQALLAALDMTGTLQSLSESRRIDLQLHFGINTGVVIAGGIGSSGRQDYSVMGDAVNLAARLEDLSKGGQILVGPTTHRLCSPLFDFEPLPPVRVKGKAEPVAVFRLIGRKQGAGSVRGLEGLRAKLVGRESEREHLRAALRRAIEGQGNIVAIAGEPGLGKSRLVADTWDEFAHDLTWAEGRALSYTSGMSYWMARDMVRCFIGAGLNDSPAETASALRRTAEVLFGPRMDEVYPFISQLVESPLEPEFQNAIRELSPGALRRRVQDAFGEWVRALCDRGPVALIWEDIHWADQSSLELIETLLPLVNELPLVILLVYRQTEGQAGEWGRRALDGHERATVITLRRLSEEASTDLMQQLLHIEALPDAVRQLILDKAEGNPFYLEEVLRSLIDAGLVLVESSHAVAIGPIDQLRIPDTLQGVVAARIDRLPPQNKNLLQLAAVIGRIFQTPVLNYLLHHEYGELPIESSLADLKQRELIRARTEIDYIFKHAVTHEVTYNSLLLSRRKELHLAAAEAIEALFPDQTDELSSTLAYHYQRAGSPTNAVRYLLLAGDRAALTYANAEAIDYFQAALHELESPRWSGGEAQRSDWRLTTHERLGDVLATTGDYNAARANYATGLSLTASADQVTLARWSRKAAESFMRQRLFADAMTHLDVATSALGDPQPDAPAWGYEHAWVLLNRIYAAYWTANLPLMLEVLIPAREAVLKHGDARQRAELHRMELAAAWQRKRFLMDEEVIRIADAHMAAAREDSRLEALAWALTMRGLSALHFFPRRLDEAEFYLRAGIDASERAGSRDVEVVGRNWLTYAYRARGDVNIVTEHAEALLVLTSSAPFYLGSAYSHLGWAALRRGDRAAAETWSRRALETWEGGPPMSKGMAHVVLLRLAWDAGQLTEAFESVRVIIDPSQIAVPRPLEDRYRAAMSAWEAEQRDAAHEELGNALRLAEEWGYS
jgi:class 3 adenylate cyclase